MQISQLHLYPIKSTLPYTVHQAFVQPQGLNFDREFMITEVDGKFITARKDEILYKFSAYPLPTGMVISAPDGEKLFVHYHDFSQTQSSEVWGNHFPSFVANEKINQWLSLYFNRPVQLRWLGQQSQRQLSQSNSMPMSFADSNPILLTSEKSLAQLNEWSPIHSIMQQFRSNIVIDGLKAFEEDHWQRIQIGEVTFTVAQQCTRCILITRNIETNQLDPNAEPFRTLKKYHTNEKGKPTFGIHLIPENSGVIKIEDKVIVLA
ncbi:MOSC N-terminal beta barrel domain-containing protein [Otariodibacter sp.]|uniref:MOSC domain-containing protein n=1 Tax=Otariodibacter sp. TaxID=3030919 RepID=UPI0026233C63|nr:MOSC N-terminal beta barrel domain-containing protein [Otariodibacter sp.]